MPPDLKEDIAKRIKRFREDDKDITQQQMADHLGMSRQNYSNVERGDQLPTLEQLAALARYSGKSYKYWIEGRDSISAGNIISINLDAKGSKPIPILDIQAAAGYPFNIDSPKYLQNCPVISMSWQQFKNGDYLMIQIKGDSMQNTLYHGDWVICRRLPDPKNEIKDGYIHVVVMRDGGDDGVVCKRLLNRLEKNGNIALQSDNQQYPTTLVKAEDVLQIWKVEFKMSAILRNENQDIFKRLNHLEGELLELKALLKK